MAALLPVSIGGLVSYLILMYWFFVVRGESAPPHQPDWKIYYPHPWQRRIIEQYGEVCLRRYGPNGWEYLPDPTNEYAEHSPAEISSASKILMR